MRALFVLAFLAVTTLFLFNSFRLRLGGGGGFLVAGFLLFFALLILSPLLSWSLTPLHVEGALIRLSYLALGFFSCLFVYTVCADLLWLCFHKIAPFLGSGRVVGILLLAAAATVLWGEVNAGKTEVVSVSLPMRGLPKAFDGFKIVQISDTHVGPFLGHAFLQRIADQISDLHPDMIVFTGDAGDGEASSFSRALLPLASLQAPYGKYYVTGNHEYYWGARAWELALEQVGFRVLNNEAVSIRKGDAAFSLVGVPDVTSLSLPPPPKTNLQEAFAKAQARPFLLLSHQPKTFDAARKLGVAAQLSGHTHGGQYFPFTIIIPLFQTYVRGLHEVDGASLYVNRGAGFWGPPLRTGGPGEITLLTLEGLK